MNHLKKLIFCTFIFSSLQSAFAQSYLKKIETNNTGSNITTAGYQLVWQDTFDGTQLDETNNWAIEVNGDGGGNAELQYYRRENISVGKEPVSGVGCLIITGKKENFSGKTCTSGRLKTYGKMSFKHGKLEARIKLPLTANGLWPAFWIMGSDYPTVGWPKCGEVDILEMGSSSGISRGTQDRYFNGACHWGESWNGGSYPNYAKATTNSYSLQDDFHLFTLIWDDSAVKMYLDLDKYPNNTPYFEMAINQADVAPNAAHYFHKQFYVIFNLAIGGNFPGIKDINNITALNNGDIKMYIDYVKVYQKGDLTEEYTGPKLVDTAVDEISIQNQFRIYPNPANDHLNIEANNQPVRVVFINMAGQEILSVSSSNSIDISALPAGNYLVKIEDVNGKIETHQLTKK